MKNFIHKHERLIQIITPMILGVVFIILCSFNLRQSIWLDESYSAYLTRFSFSDIWNFTASDVHPPLFYFVLKIWSMIFGYTDFGMRFMSVFFGAIAIVFAWHWLKRKFGVKPAILATLLMTISPMFLRYGQEMRMYTMAAAIIFGATYTLELAIDTKKRKFWIIYGVLISLGMWTHYFTALIWLAQLAYLIFVYRKKIFQKNIITSYVLAVILYLPWLPSLIKQTGVVQSGFWIGDTSISTISDFFTNTFFYLDAGKVIGWILPLALVLFCSLIYLLRKPGKNITLLRFMALLPIVLLILFSLPPLTPIFVDRYIIYSGLCLAIAAGVGIVIIKFKNKATPIILGCVFVGASIIGISNVYSVGNGKVDTKAVFESIAATSENGIPIIANTELLYMDMSFYGSDDHPVYFLEELSNYEWGLHEPFKQKDFGKISNLDDFLKNHDTIWFVGIKPEEGSIELPREEGLTEIQIMELSINNSPVPYQAIELTRAEN